MGRPKTLFCNNNHERTPENTHIRKDGVQSCRTCSRNRMAYRRRKAKQDATAQLEQGQ